MGRPVAAMAMWVTGNLVKATVVGSVWRADVTLRVMKGKKRR
jgi:hypothetical protein